MRSICCFFLLFTIQLIYASPPDTTIITKPSGSSFGKIFSNFHYQISDPEPETAFEVKRAYLGFKRDLDQNFKAIVEIDIGSPNDDSPYSKLKRYAYFKNAGLTYTNDKIEIRFGLIDIVQFKLQEKFWGYRYIFESFMDEYSFGPSADLGTIIIYKPNSLIELDYSLLNGEGYSNLQLDNIFKHSFGMTVRPNLKLVVRLYYDLMYHEVTQSTLAGFVGLTLSNSWSIGGEYIYRYNDEYQDGLHTWGYSFYSTYVLNDRWQVFGRFDKLASVRLENETYGWNIANDGSALLMGMQFHPTEMVKISANYQDWVPYPVNYENESYLYLNLEVSF
jgi:hypothetical protein